MSRIVILIASIWYSSVALALASYQVDLILFAFPQATEKQSDFTLNTPLLPVTKNAITLKSSSDSLYNLLAASKSTLANEYYLLSRKSPYQVLGHYSWIQPSTNQSNVALPHAEQHGWQIQGTVRIRQSNYYQLSTDLQLSAPNNPETSFSITQKQRLKPEIVYFLDHPQVGMLIKIHKLAP